MAAPKTRRGVNNACSLAGCLLCTFQIDAILMAACMNEVGGDGGMTTLGQVFLQTR